MFILKYLSIKEPCITDNINYKSGPCISILTYMNNESCLFLTQYLSKIVPQFKSEIELMANLKTFSKNDQ